MYRVSIDRKGIDFARGAMALALARTDSDATAIALKRWGDDSGPLRCVKAAVLPVDGTALLSSPAAAEFFASVQQSAT